jgi:hypothetical protein
VITIGQVGFGITIIEKFQWTLSTCSTQNLLYFLDKNSSISFSPQESYAQVENEEFLVRLLKTQTRTKDKKEDQKRRQQREEEKKKWRRREKKRTANEMER